MSPDLSTKVTNPSLGLFSSLSCSVETWISLKAPSGSPLEQGKGLATPVKGPMAAAKTGLGTLGPAGHIPRGDGEGKVKGMVPAVTGEGAENWNGGRTRTSLDRISSFTPWMRTGVQEEELPGASGPSPSRSPRSAPRGSRCPQSPARPGLSRSPRWAPSPRQRAVSCAGCWQELGGAGRSQPCHPFPRLLAGRDRSTDGALAGSARH